MRRVSVTEAERDAPVVAIRPIAAIAARVAMMPALPIAVPIGRIGGATSVPIALPVTMPIATMAAPMTPKMISAILAAVTVFVRSVSPRAVTMPGVIMPAVSVVPAAMRLGVTVITVLVTMTTRFGVVRQPERENCGNEKSEPSGFHVNLLGLC